MSKRNFNLSPFILIMKMCFTRRCYLLITQKQQNDISSINKTKILSYCSILFAFISFAIFWRICETVTLIYIDDVMYANWTQHGLKYFWEQIVWHFENFNGRTFIHVFLSLILSAKEHIYAIIIPLCVMISAWFSYDLIKSDAKYYEKLFACGFVNIAFLSLPTYYLSSGLLWMSGGINYIFPLFLVLFGYTLYKKSLTNGKYIIPAFVATFIGGATTEQWGMYMIGLITLSLLFYFIEKDKKCIKTTILMLASSAAGYISIFLSPGTSTRAQNHSNILNIISGFGTNNRLLYGNGLFLIVIGSIVFLLAFIMRKYNKRAFVANMILAILYCIFAIINFPFLAGICLLILFVSTSITLMKNEKTREMGKLLFCGYGTFFMMSIASDVGFRTFIPFLITSIIVIICLYFNHINNIKKDKLYTIVIVAFGLCLSVSCISFATGCIKAEKIYNKPIYEDILNIENGGVAHINIDLLEISDKYAYHRYNSSFDVGGYSDTVHLKNYYGLDTLKFHNTSNKYDVSDIYFDDISYFYPVIHKDGKSYVPHTVLTANLNCEKAIFPTIAEISKDNELCTGCSVSTDHFYAVTMSGGIMSVKDGTIMHLNQQADSFVYSFKSIDVLYIELSEFCKWSNTEYTYDSANNTYYFITK